MNTETATIRTSDLRPGMILDNGLAVVEIVESDRRGHLRVTTDRAETPRGSRTFEIHRGSRIRVTLESFRTYRNA